MELETHRTDSVGIGGIEAAEDVGGRVRLWAAASRRRILLLGGGVVTRARVELECAQVPPAVRKKV